MRTHPCRPLILAMLLAAAFVSSKEANAEPVIFLRPVASGLSSPVRVVSPSDGTHRLFVVDQVGLIWIVDASGTLLPDPFLDLRARLVPLNTSYDERGLLGLAFHPDYAHNGRFFVKYSAPLRPDAPPTWDHTNVVSEFAVSANPNIADPNSERIIIQFDHPQFNHNSGALAFGPDGYLYLAEGDGGGANDVGDGHSVIGNGQDIHTLLGKFMRIDVNGDQPYGIPPDNPFVGQDGLDEIFAYGFRNPYSFSFDRGGDRALISGDAGQNRFEEVDHVEIGMDYGWNLKEGTHCFNPNDPDNPPDSCGTTGYLGEPLIDPVIEYANANTPSGGLGLAVIGGFMYRGNLLSQYRGKYIFGDFSRAFGAPGDGSLFLATPLPPGQGLWPFEQFQVVRDGSPIPGRLGQFLKGFGQDDRGELYVTASDELGPAGTSGRVYLLAGPSVGNGPSLTSLRVANGGARVGIAGADGAGMVLDLSDAAHVSVVVYDVTGRAIRSLMDSVLPAGRREVSWDGRDGNGRSVPSGIYFYQVRSGSEETQRRILRLR